MGSFSVKLLHVIGACGDLKFDVVRVWILIEHGRGNQVAVTF
jgi:hypothetical protein